MKSNVFNNIYNYFTNTLVISPDTVTGPTTMNGFWLGTTFQNDEYIFDGNLGRVKDFSLQARNGNNYWLQVK